MAKRKLYLCESETQDGIERFLDLTATANPAGYDSIRTSIILPEAELRDLLENGSEATVFGKLGVKDLSSSVGALKGPYYSVDRKSLDK
jgi:hypothetical protein